MLWSVYVNIQICLFVETYCETRRGRKLFVKHATGTMPRLSPALRPEYERKKPKSRCTK
jgi:hypothetical protein